MSDQQNLRPKVNDEQGVVHNESAVDGAAQAKIAEIDALLNDIDSVLETNAAAFVQGFVQKGGE